MINIKRFNNKQITFIIIITLIVVTTIILYIVKAMAKNEDENIDFEDNIIGENSITNNENEISEDKILVHVSGCVKSKGIVILKKGDRILDAIEAAGGETDDADLEKLNLAYELQDGEKLKVPSKNEKDENEYITSDSGNNVIVNKSGNEEEEKTKMININNANKEELMTLSGVGESTANKIIKYREENGKFKKIEDIKNVPGIGDVKFENIKDKIVVK